MSPLEMYIQNSKDLINTIKADEKTKQKWIDEVNNAQELLDMWNEHERRLEDERD